MLSVFRGYTVVQSIAAPIAIVLLRPLATREAANGGGRQLTADSAIYIGKRKPFWLIWDDGFGPVTSRPM